MASSVPLLPHLFAFCISSILSLASRHIHHRYHFSTYYKHNGGLIISHSARWNLLSIVPGSLHIYLRASILLTSIQDTQCTLVLSILGHLDPAHSLQSQREPHPAPPSPKARSHSPPRTKRHQHKHHRQRRQGHLRRRFREGTMVQHLRQLRRNMYILRFTVEESFRYETDGEPYVLGA